MQRFVSILALFFAVCVKVAARPNEPPAPTELLQAKSVFIQVGMVFGQKHVNRCGERSYQKAWKSRKGWRA